MALDNIVVSAANMRFAVHHIEYMNRCVWVLVTAAFNLAPPPSRPRPNPTQDATHYHPEIPDVTAWMARSYPSLFKVHGADLRPETGVRAPALAAGPAELTAPVRVLAGFVAALLAPSTDPTPSTI